MEHIRLTAISLSLLLCTVSAFAQRHYENIHRTSYWKAGLSYFEKPYEYTPNLPQVSTLNPEETIPETIHDKGKDFYVDGGYYRTLASNLKSVYWSIGLGGFIGTEYVRHPDKEYNFIIGPKLETELEVFILPRTALLARIQQHWNPLSIDKWNTVWNVGIKILLY